MKTDEHGFLLSEGETLTLETAVFQALGEASTCWENLRAAGTFDSTRAKDVGERLIAAIREKGLT